MQKKQYLAATFTGIVLIGASLALSALNPLPRRRALRSGLHRGRKLQSPTGYRRRVFVGAPLTPNALNNGMAAFPEYHHVYVEQENLDAYLKTGSFPEGTIFVKELTRVLNPTFPDGSRTKPPGRGYFNGELNGIDLTVKNSKLFPNSNGWGFFTFGYHPLPYAESAKESPVTQCAFCHMANVAKTDITWVQFYPLLRDDLTTAQRRTTVKNSRSSQRR